MRKLKLYGILLIVTSCIQTPEPDVPKRVTVVYNVENMGSDIVVAEDTISVDVVKLLAEKINFSSIDDRILQTQPVALVMTYRSLFNGQDETIFAANIGIDDFRGFKKLELFINIPEEGDNINDNEFFSDPDNFSFIIKGSYNDRNFTYRSRAIFSKNFPFSNNIQLSNENETLLTRISYDIKEVLVDTENNQILDPDNPDNQEFIDSLLQKSLDIEASAVNSL